MLSLKFDLLLPSLNAARHAARTFNSLLKPPARPADPREYKRMLDELRLARETSKLRELAHRKLFLP